MAIQSSYEECHEQVKTRRAFGHLSDIEAAAGFVTEEEEAFGAAIDQRCRNLAFSAIDSIKK